MFQVKSLIPVVVLAALGGGCYSGIEGVDLTDEIAEMRSTHSNGISLNNTRLNGISLNGISLNGISLNGISLNGISLNGISLNGISLNGISLNGISLNGISLNGSSLGGSLKYKGKKYWREGDELIGAEFHLSAQGVDANNKPGIAPVILRIDDVYEDEDYDDILYYDLSFKHEGTNKWTPLCVDANNEPLPVIPLRNYWNEKTGDRIDDSSVVTFACTSGVLAHCTQWGYRPWEEAEQCDNWQKGKKNCDDVSLRDYHQACTRMARADYCGDGTTWTVAGTPIDISDHLSPQIEKAETKWPVEAEWNPNGAYCLKDIRQQEWKAQGLYPQCPKPLAKKKDDCGSLDDHRALLISQFEKKK